MSSPNRPSPHRVPDEIAVNEDHAFVTLITPAQGRSDMPALTKLFEAHRAFFLDKLQRRGVLMFRGFPPGDVEQFNTFIVNGMGLTPWNGFNLKGMPTFVTDWLRKYTEGLMGGGDYRRYLDRNVVQLG